MKKWLCPLTLLAFTVAAFLGNFEEFFHGDDPAEVWNFLLSMGYLAAWGWFLWEKSSKKALWFACIWWTISLLGAVSWIGLQYLYFPVIFIVGAWTLSPLCLGELFGLNFLLNLPYGGLFLVFLAICTVMLCLSIRKMKKLHYR